MCDYWDQLRLHRAILRPAGFPAFASKVQKAFNSCHVRAWCSRDERGLACSRPQPNILSCRLGSPDNMDGPTTVYPRPPVAPRDTCQAYSCFHSFSSAACLRPSSLPIETNCPVCLAHRARNSSSSFSNHLCSYKHRQLLPRSSA